MYRDRGQTTSHNPPADRRTSALLRVTTATAAVLAALALLGAACSGGGEAPPNGSAEASTPASQSTPSPAAAGSAEPDATEPGSAATPGEPPPPLPPSIARALAEIAEVRDLDPPPDLRANVIRRSELPDLLDSLITDEERETYHNTTTLYRLLGHFTDDQDYLSLYTAFGATGILGLYSPLDDELWIVSDAGTEGLENLSRSESETLAHELVHALQDYNFSLDETLRQLDDSLDRSLAYIALVEGDAVIHEGLYSDNYLLLRPAGRLGLVGIAQTGPAAIPTSFIRELIFPYTDGADFARSIRGQGGTAALDEYLANPPSSTSVILHPEIEARGFVPEVMELPRLEDALGASWEWESGGTVGEFHLGNYLQLGLSGASAREAATGWAGDRYDVYVGGTDSLAILRLRFGTEREAEEFADAHLRMLDGRALDSGMEGETRVFELDGGKWTAVPPRNGPDILFVAATSKDLALQALALIAGS
ncbi:MAG: hypothetical protein ACE5EF_10485 [Dehalococcoidia bacterium]